MCECKDGVNKAKNKPESECDAVKKKCPLKDECGGNKGSKTSENRIDIEFDPDKSCKKVKCEKIVHVQFIKMSVDGKIVKPGDLYSGWKYRDVVYTKSGWWIDHLKPEKTPDYQQGSGDGKKNGGSVKARISDTPDIIGFVPNGFYNPASNKSGTKVCPMEFVTFAWCMKGTDCGKWYDGITWEYKKTWKDHKDGKNGESKITNNNVTSGPSKSQIKAFNKFNKEKGFTPCK